MVKLKPSKCPEKCCLHTFYITNSLKYAFANSETGKIILTMESRDGRCFLEIRDNGIGLPDGFSIENSGTLGMTLVKNLVMQLQGTFRLYNDGGTVFSCNFPSD